MGNLESGSVRQDPLNRIHPLITAEDLRHVVPATHLFNTMALKAALEADGRNLQSLVDHMSRVVREEAARNAKPSQLSA